MIDNATRTGNLRGGFTLLELIVVISVITALAAMGYPAYLGIKHKVDVSSTDTLVNSVATAIETYSTKTWTWNEGTPAAPISRMYHMFDLNHYNYSSGAPVEKPDLADAPKGGTKRYWSIDGYTLPEKSPYFTSPNTWEDYKYPVAPDLDANGEGLNASRYTITVGALHQDGFASSYSNYGACLLVSTSGGDFNTVRAGLGTVSTDLLGVDGYNNRGASGTASDYTNDFGGTSSAAPILTGVISLMLSANSQLGWRDVQNILAMSADHTGSAIGVVTPGSEENNTWFINAARNWNGGGMHFSEDYGYGAVNVYAAVRIAEVWSQFASAQTSANEVFISDTGIGGAINDLTTNIFTFNIGFNALAEHIDLTLGLTHTAFSDLRIFLVSPQGTEVQLYDGIGGATANGLVWTFGMENFRGENTAGTWTIKIIDAVGTDTGTLNSVLFNGFGSTINTNDVYTYTDEFNAMKLLNAARGTLTDNNGGTDWINAAAISTDVILDLNPNSVVAGRLLTIAAGTIENAVTGDGNDSITGNSVAIRTCITAVDEGVLHLNN